MVIGLSGWMDGGEVSTGAVEYLVGEFGATDLAEIDPADFYIYNVPGPMEISALFRPRARIEEGLVTLYEEPSNKFYYSDSASLVLFSGKEPNIGWRNFADCIFTVANKFNVTRICFVGSIGGLVPHTREPVFYSSATDETFRSLIVRFGMNPTNYEGPSSFATYLIRRAREYNISMASIVAGIPSYVQGRNAKCIEAAVHRVAGVLGLRVDIAALKSMREEFLKGVEKIVKERPDLAEHIKKLEEAYDEQTSEPEQDELRDWFEKQGIRLN